MQVRSAFGNIGISQISYKHGTDNKPNLTLDLHFSDQNYQHLLNKGYWQYGILSSDPLQRHLRFTITGYKKISAVIQLFLAQTDIYPEKENRDVSSRLQGIDARCKQEIAKKPVKLPPEASLPLTDFKMSEATDILHSFNVTHKVEKITNPQEKYIYKANTTGRQVSELETFNAYCYRLLLGDRHPRVMNVHGVNGERAGLVSEIIEFTSIADLEKKNEFYPDSLLTGEAVKVWVAAYVEEEEDLHNGNWGIGANGMCVKIDDDRATWPLTSKYAGFDAENNTELLTAPKNTFPVTERDILSLPSYQDANPPKGPEYSRNAFQLDQLMRKKQFIEDKYYMFLKRILIPAEVYDNIANATIRSASTARKFAAHKNDKTTELGNTLLNMPEFRQYMIDHPQAFLQILDEFEEYNRDFPEDSNLRINLDTIKQKYYEIRPSFFERHPYIKYALIGFTIGLTVAAIILLIAAIPHTFGATIPIITPLVAKLGLMAALLLPAFAAIGAGLGVAYKKLCDWVQNNNDIDDGGPSPSIEVDNIPVRKLEAGTEWQALLSKKPQPVQKNINVLGIPNMADKIRKKEEEKNWFGGNNMFDHKKSDSLDVKLSNLKDKMELKKKQL